ncbi:MAG TPA: hypothetical protein VF637_03100 [Sphingomicrobium sp.]
MNTFVQILIASVGFGTGMEGVGQYRRFKARRRIQAFAERNSGFWTDRRLYRAEASLAAIALAMPWTAFAVFIPIDRPMWVMTLVLLSYALAIYVLISNLNRPDPQ